MKKSNKGFFLKTSVFSYLKYLKKYKKPNYKYFNLKLIVAGDFERYKVYEKPFVVPDNKGDTGIRGQAKDKERSIKKSMNRAKEKVYGYIMCNNFEYWATQTFNNKKLDRYSIDEIVKKYNRRLKYLKTKYINLKWLIVPEQHSDGAWHLHMFMSGIPKDRIVYSGYDYYNKEKKFSRKIYNWVDTIDFGFNDYVYTADIGPLEKYRIATYIIKYITKDLALNRFNRKMYWASKDLTEPLIERYLIKDINEFNFKSNQLILTESTYFIKDEQGQVINKVEDFTIYKPLPF